MEYKNKLLVNAIIGALSITVANAAERIQLDKQAKNLSIASQGAPSSIASNPAQLLGLSENHSLIAYKSFLSKRGDATVRYNQEYKGVPVIGDNVVIARFKDNSFKLAYGSVLNAIEQDLDSLDPALSIEDAITIAKQKSSANTKLLDGQPLIYENEESMLAIWQDDNGKARLVYEVSYVQHAAEPSRPYILIDAMTGDVLHSYDNLQTADGTGPGGNVKTGQYEYGTDFGHLDVTQSGSDCAMDNTNVRTINLNHGSSGSAAFTFPCIRNTTKEINGAYSPLNDAHYFGGVVFRMYSDWLNAAPLSFQLKMRVHYQNNYENAFWDGRAMTFGDGRNTFYPLVSLDVASHEVSHGYTEQNSDLTYSGKSGGLNESFSDVAGEAAEFFNSGSNDWKVGEQIFKANGALRYMDDPTRDGRSIGNQADYRNGMDVHYSSGVFNKAFYTLANTTGWDTKKAFLAYATANKMYWTKNTNWDSAGGGVMDAACDLDYNVDDVKAALAAVGVTSVLSNDKCGGGGGDPTDPTDTELMNGVPIEGISGAAKEQKFYIMKVPAGASGLVFTTKGGSGDADLYVKFGSKPTLRDYDCRSTSSNSNERCAIRSVREGTYHVMVEAWNAISGVSLTGSHN